jgi:hypothetical protein
LFEHSGNGPGYTKEKEHIKPLIEQKYMLTPVNVHKLSCPFDEVLDRFVHIFLSISSEVTAAFHIVYVPVHYVRKVTGGNIDAMLQEKLDATS